MTEEQIKKTYQELQKDKVHPNYPNCSCPSCLYHFIKSRNKKTRIDKDNFFLYWLVHVYSYTKDKKRSSKFFTWNKDRVHDWSYILRVCKKIPELKSRIIQMEEEADYWRRISRYDKKFNISGIINARDDIRIRAPIEISWFMFELENIFEIMRQRTKYDFPLAHSLSPKDLELAFSEFFKPVLKYAFKIFEHLINKLKKGEQISQREISRKFHINRDNLMLFLSYLEFRKLIIWDKKNKKISLHPDYLFWLMDFEGVVHLIFDGIKEMAPYSIRDAKDIFDKGTEYTLKLYEQTKAAKEKKI